MREDELKPGMAAALRARKDHKDYRWRTKDGLVHARTSRTFASGSIRSVTSRCYETDMYMALEIVDEPATCLECLAHDYGDR